MTSYIDLLDDPVPFPDLPASAPAKTASKSTAPKKSTPKKSAPKKTKTTVVADTQTSGEFEEVVVSSDFLLVEDDEINGPYGLIQWNAPPGEVTPGSGALRLCGKEFFDLINSVASEHTLPKPGSIRSVEEFNESIKWYRPTVSLIDVAKTLGVPPEYARPYLRAVYGHLATLGVIMRERRLAHDGALAEVDWKYCGHYIEPAEKNRLYQERGAARRALSEARSSASDKSAGEVNRLTNSARARLVAAEEAIKEMKDKSDHLPVERHAYVVVADRNVFDLSAIYASLGVSASAEEETTSVEEETTSVEEGNEE